jgi:hypothetical protein
MKPMLQQQQQQPIPTWLQRVTGVVASLGNGKMISTFVATLRSLNWLRALTT